MHTKKYIRNWKRLSGYESYSRQEKKDVGTLSNSLSGDTKQIYKGRTPSNIIERSAVNIVDNHPAERKLTTFVKSNALGENRSEIELHSSFFHNSFNSPQEFNYNPNHPQIVKFRNKYGKNYL
jgi:hypothetical protein